MCDFLHTVPTGKHAFEVGCNVMLGHGDELHLGVGILAAYDSKQFWVRGIQIDTIYLKGTMDYDLYSADGVSWTLEINFQGSGGGTKVITTVDGKVEGLSCAYEPGDDITYAGSYGDGTAMSMIQKVSGNKKLYFKHINLVEFGWGHIAFPGISTADMELYFYNQDSMFAALTTETEQITLDGIILGPDGRGIEGLTIEAWDKDLLSKHDRLGTMTTLEDGVFRIHVKEEDHRLWIFDKKPDVYFKVFHQGQQIHSTEENVIWNVTENQFANIQLESYPEGLPATIDDHSGMVGIYGGKILEKESYVEDIIHSGMNTYLFWSVHVEPKGDLVHFGPPKITICGEGEYKGPSDWKAKLVQMLLPPSSVRTIAFSVGSAGTSDYANIKTLIDSQGTGPDSILYQNFAALKTSLPEISVIDLDDEDSYDQETIVRFSTMLHQIGFSVTFCPYVQPSFWVDCLYALNGSGTNIVTGFNLQCYSGGSGNAHSQKLQDDWITPIMSKMGWSQEQAAAFIRPGLDAKHGKKTAYQKKCSEGNCPSQIKQKLDSWKSLGITGAWIWSYGELLSCKDYTGCTGESIDLKSYTDAILNSLG